MGTEYALYKAGRMSQTITLPAVNAQTIGQLLYFFEMVTAYTGELLDILCGTCFICGLGEDDFCSLTEEQLLRYERMYQHPEIFLWNGSRLLVLEVN